MKSDAVLVADALSGGPEAFGPVVERYQRAVFAVAVARLKDFDQAEDLAQEVFIRAFERLTNLKKPERLGPWLRSITIHCCIDQLRRRRDEIDIEQMADQLEDPLTPQTEIERRELRGQVLQAIGRLSQAQRETTALFYIDGYAQEEIAAIQEVPVGTVKRRLHDARKKLKEEMLEMVEGTLQAGAPREDFAERVFQLLWRYPHKSNYRIRWAETIAELGEIGAPGIEGFQKALDQPHWPTRTLTMRMLHEAKPSATEAVIDLLKKGLEDSNRKVRFAAAQGLLELPVDERRRREEILPLVLQMLFDPSRRLRRFFALTEVMGKWAAHIPIETVARAIAQEEDEAVRERMRRLLQMVIAAHDDKSK